MELSTDVSGSVGGAGAIYIPDTFEECKEVSSLMARMNGSFFTNYWRLPSWHIVPQRVMLHDLYYVVFKPYDHNYDPKFNAMDHVRKKIGNCFKIIIVREILALKVHYHAMVWCARDLKTALHDKCTNRYKIHCQYVPAEDRMVVHNYLIKEALRRYFYGIRNKVHRIPDIYCYQYNQKSEVILS